MGWLINCGCWWVDQWLSFMDIKHKYDHICVWISNEKLISQVSAIFNKCHGFSTAGDWMMIDIRDFCWIKLPMVFYQLIFALMHYQFIISVEYGCRWIVDIYGSLMAYNDGVRKDYWWQRSWRIIHGSQRSWICKDYPRELPCESPTSMLCTSGLHIFYGVYIGLWGSTILKLYPR